MKLETLDDNTLALHSTCSDKLEETTGLSQQTPVVNSFLEMGCFLQVNTSIKHRIHAKHTAN
jgi:hypothetical protein